MNNRLAGTSSWMRSAMLDLTCAAPNISQASSPVQPSMNTSTFVAVTSVPSVARNLFASRASIIRNLTFSAARRGVNTLTRDRSKAKPDTRFHLLSLHPRLSRRRYRTWCHKSLGLASGHAMAIATKASATASDGAGTLLRRPSRSVKASPSCLFVTPSTLTHFDGMPGCDDLHSRSTILRIVVRCAVVGQLAYMAGASQLAGSAGNWRATLKWRAKPIHETR